MIKNYQTFNKGMLKIYNWILEKLKIKEKTEI